jgi:beta-lactamase class D
MKRFYFSLLVFFVVFQVNTGQVIKTVDFKTYFDEAGVNGCFALYDLNDSIYVRYNTERCDSEYLPASTFKIPNTLIALEEKIVKSDTQTIKWDGTVWDRKEMNQDQDLRTAFKYSVIWVYFEFAREIGLGKYKEYLTSFDYGNKDLSGPEDKFWLAGGLRISANQQVEFLKNFYTYRLNVFKSSIDVVKRLMVIEAPRNYTFSGKSGGGYLPDKRVIMWLVGYVERAGNVYFYALNFTCDKYTEETGKLRFSITKNILKELKVI